IEEKLISRMICVSGKVRFCRFIFVYFITKPLREKDNAKPLAFAISWTHSPVAKNSGFALRQFRHDGEFRLMKFRKCSRSFAYAFPFAAVFL
ncbi:MAG: hypothetical protein IJ056_09070, partial [Acidaminococcaceae bacterium]|nr:hypothetical protein [Acidaminococcaceae bacterium]